MGGKYARGGEYPSLEKKYMGKLFIFRRMKRETIFTVAGNLQGARKGKVLCPLHSVEEGGKVDLCSPSMAVRKERLQEGGSCSSLGRAEKSTGSTFCRIRDRT